MAQICVTVTGRTMEELRRARDAAAADVVEVRLDGVDRPDVAAALEGRRCPVIVTCRPSWEGGKFDGSEEERERLLLAAMDGGAEFVDVERRARFAADIIRTRRGRGLIASFHRFEPGPADVAEELRALRSTGAQIIKLAVAVDSLAETLPLFELGARRGHDGDTEQGHVVIAMGPRGVHTRVLAARLGNRWTYAGDAVAPGQMPASQLLDEFTFRRIRPDADLYGVVGSPIAHSLSPAMHNAGFAQAGLNAAYVAVDARDADDFVTFARAMKMRGASITAPFKVDLLRHADECEPLAREVGAINTLVMQDDKWTGRNTDVHGLIGPLAERIDLADVRAAVLGAGGAARAAVAGLKHAGAHVQVCARRADQGAALAAGLGVESGPFPPAAGSWDVLVNTVPGVEGEQESPMRDTVMDGRIVFDLTYAPEVTPLIAQARAAGCETIGGIEMLIRQAEKQFETWTGAPPPAGLFRAAADAARARKSGVRS
ncbi:MAG: type I 3-dehydroquinate dehydratase [Acidobacteriota bacterium]|nr:type I 3-dehydroquinate dehydratase [Acidobacteriota bacterium]